MAKKIKNLLQRGLQAIVDARMRQAQHLMETQKWIS
jgi:hypothetical protein